LKDFDPKKCVNPILLTLKARQPEIRNLAKTLLAKILSITGDKHFKRRLMDKSETEKRDLTSIIQNAMK